MFKNLWSNNDTIWHTNFVIPNSTSKWKIISVIVKSLPLKIKSILWPLYNSTLKEIRNKDMFLDESCNRIRERTWRGGMKTFATLYSGERLKENPVVLSPARPNECLFRTKSWRVFARLRSFPSKRRRATPEKGFPLISTMATFASRFPRNYKAALSNYWEWSTPIFLSVPSTNSSFSLLLPPPSKKLPGVIIPNSS